MTHATSENMLTKIVSFFFLIISMACILYENTPKQYTVIFHGCKNNNFQMKNCDFFLIFAVNIDRGYTLEPPERGGSNEYPQSMC